MGGVGTRRDKKARVKEQYKSAVIHWGTIGTNELLFILTEASESYYKMTRRNVNKSGNKSV